MFNIENPVREMHPPDLLQMMSREDDGLFEAKKYIYKYL